MSDEAQLHGIGRSARTVAELSLVMAALGDRFDDMRTEVRAALAMMVRTDVYAVQRAADQEKVAQLAARMDADANRADQNRRMYIGSLISGGAAVVAALITIMINFAHH